MQVAEQVGEENRHQSIQDAVKLQQAVEAELMAGDKEAREGRCESVRRAKP